MSASRAVFFRVMSLRQALVALVAVAGAGVVAVAPATARGDDDPAAAYMKEAAGYAARARAAESPEDAAIAALQAFNTWRRANKLDGDRQHLCRARAVLDEVLVRGDLEATHRTGLESRRASLAAIECPGRAPRRSGAAARPRGGTEVAEIPVLGVDRGAAEVQMVVVDLRPDTDSQKAMVASTNAASSPDDQPPVREGKAAPRRSVALLDPGALAGPTMSTDRLRASPKTIAGATILGLAALPIGGLVYAALRDVAIAGEVRELQQKLETSGEHDDARIEALELEAHRALQLEIGFGVASAALVGAGVGLLISGRRSGSARALSLTPQAGVAFGGVALSGRF